MILSGRTVCFKRDRRHLCKASYLGGNDVETAKAVAERCDVPVKKILNMPVETNWIFRRGQVPVNAHNFDLEPFLAEKKLNDKEGEER